MSELTDQVARDKAEEAAHSLKNHIQVTGIKLDILDKRITDTHNDTNNQIGRVESMLKWAGSLIVMLFISALGWSLAQQYNANESTKKDLQAQVELLREQQRNSMAARADRAQILSRLPASGAETTGATDSVTQ